MLVQNSPHDSRQGWQGDTELKLSLFRSVPVLKIRVVPPHLLLSQHFAKLSKIVANRPALPHIAALGGCNGLRVGTSSKP